MALEPISGAATNLHRSAGAGDKLDDLGGDLSLALAVVNKLEVLLELLKVVVGASSDKKNKLQVESTVCTLRVEGLTTGCAFNKSKSQGERACTAASPWRCPRRWPWRSCARRAPTRWTPEGNGGSGRSCRGGGERQGSSSRGSTGSDKTTRFKLKALLHPFEYQTHQTLKQGGAFNLKAKVCFQFSMMLGSGSGPSAAALPGWGPARTASRPRRRRSRRRPPRA